MPFDIARDIFGIGLTKGQKLKKAFLGSVGSSVGISVVSMPMIAFQAAKSDKGGFMPAIIGQSMAITAGIPIAGFASAALSLIPGVGPIAAIVIGSLLSDYAEFRIGSALIKKVRLFTNANKRIRHLEMGGSYRDSELAQRQRMIALRDMNAAMIPGRRYLGQESVLMHR